MHDRDNISELGLERRVEVCAALDGSEAVAVCQLGEDSDIAAVLKLNACKTEGKQACVNLGRKDCVRVAMVGGGLS